MKKGIVGVVLTVTLIISSIQALTIAQYKDLKDAKKGAKVIDRLLKSAGIDINTTISKKDGIYKINTGREVNEKEKQSIEQSLLSSLKADRKRVNSKKKYKKTRGIKIALKLFSKGEYEKAYRYFKKYDKKLKNPKLLFYYGKSAFETGRYSKALSIYKRLIDSGHNTITVKFEYARTLVKLGDIQTAQEIVEEILQQPLPAEARVNLERYLKALEIQNKKNIFNGSLMIGVGYDDNIYNHTYLGTTEYGETELENNTSSISDSFHTETLSLHHLYIFDNRKIAWDTTIDLYNQTYRKYSDVNIFLGSIISGPRYYDGEKKIYIPILYNRLWYGTDDYMQIIGGRPEISYLLNKDTSTDIKILYIEKKYKKSDDKDKDCNLFGAKIGINRVFKGKKYLRVESGAYGERRKRGDRKDISFNMATVGVKYYTPLFEKINLYSYGTFEYYNYLKNDPNMSDRRDKRFKIDIDLSREITKNISLEAKYSYTKNLSTINLYEYKKSIATINLMATF